MPSGSSHDLLDWIAAVGPTVAAASAAWAAWTAVGVARRSHEESQTFQRNMSRPLLLIESEFQFRGNEMDVRVSLKNVGKTPANVAQLSVFAGGTKIAPNLLDNPDEYWSRVLSCLEIATVITVTGNLYKSKFVQDADSTRRLITATLLGDRTLLQKALGRLEIELEFTDPWEERRTVRSNIGATFKDC